MRRSRRVATLLLAGVVAASCAGASSGSEDGPGGGDGDPTAAVDTIFFEDFEGGSLARWDDNGQPERHSVVDLPGQARSGSRALEFRYASGSDGAGWLTKFFMPGYDSAYVSVWVKYDPAWMGSTKLLSLYGSRTDDMWSAAGKASVCPNGTDFFVATLTHDVSAGNPPPLRFYTYYPAMPREPDGRTCYGAMGAGLASYQPAEPSRGAWHHVEFWVRLNAPGASNAIQRFWVDGVERGSWAGIALRSSDVLRLNSVTLSASSSGGAPQAQRVWMDDVLVARQRPPAAR